MVNFLHVWFKNHLKDGVVSILKAVKTICLLLNYDQEVHRMAPETDNEEKEEIVIVKKKVDELIMKCFQ